MLSWSFLWPIDRALTCTSCLAARSCTARLAAAFITVALAARAQTADQRLRFAAVVGEGCEKFVDDVGVGACPGQWRQRHSRARPRFAEREEPDRSQRNRGLAGGAPRQRHVPADLAVGGRECFRPLALPDAAAAAESRLLGEHLQPAHRRPRQARAVWRCDGVPGSRLDALGPGHGHRSVSARGCALQPADDGLSGRDFSSK